MFLLLLICFQPTLLIQALIKLVIPHQEEVWVFDPLCNVCNSAIVALESSGFWIGCEIDENMVEAGKSFLGKIFLFLFCNLISNVDQFLAVALKHHKKKQLEMANGFLDGVNDLVRAKIAAPTAKEEKESGSLKKPEKKKQAQPTENRNIHTLVQNLSPEELEIVKVIHFSLCFCCINFIAETVVSTTYRNN